ncbi:MAG: DUF389 domain-containing protein [Crocinitomicaceae bacterium]|nr:DUF389 domain-containing protein [Crocinitomicaceae bacterium]
MSEETEQEPENLSNGQDNGNKGPEPSARSEEPPNEHDPTKIRIDKNPANLISGMAGFLKSILSLRNVKYDIQGVLENVRDGIVFSGYNVWVLMCSIIVASVGLNMDSTAVIIGAMLISPLMGPIRGIGFGVAMNDFKLLLDSLKNFGITVAISVTTSYVYFLITPIHDVTDNLFARTEPTFLDVVIAFFGGLSGVIALSKKKADTVIPGVAIATALMPPLCTAGFGLATGQWNYFLGASYLFLLNSLLIATSTYLFIRYLKFPKKEYVSPKIEKRVKAYTLLFIIVTVAPSIYMFYRMTKRSIFESNSEAFVNEIVMNTDPNITVDATYHFDWEDSYILMEISNYYADDYVIEQWNRHKERYELEKVDLRIKQGRDNMTIWQEMLDEYSKSNEGANTVASVLHEVEMDNRKLRKKIEEMEKNPIPKEDPFKVKDLLAGFKIDYPEYSNIAIDRGFMLNNKNELDTIYTLTVKFKNNVNPSERAKLNSKLSRRVKLELKQKANFKQDSVHVYTLE